MGRERFSRLLQKIARFNLRHFPIQSKSKEECATRLQTPIPTDKEKTAEQETGQGTQNVRKPVPETKNHQERIFLAELQSNHDFDSNLGELQKTSENLKYLCARPKNKKIGYCIMRALSSMSCRKFRE